MCKRYSVPTLLLISLAAVTGASPARGGSRDIVDAAVAAGSFKTLATALKAAGLISALKTDGPFTVFAPTDEAFAALPAGTLESLLKPENKSALIGILKYHVIAGRFSAADIERSAGLLTIGGQRLDIDVKPGSISVDQSRVVQVDIACSNGIIHVIDQVVLPASDDLAATAAKAGAFKTLLAAASAAGLVDALRGEGPLTVLAPTDDAFAKLPAGTVESLLKPENRAKLAAILKYHILPGRITAAGGLRETRLKSLEGNAIIFDVRSGNVSVNDARIVRNDIDASNGVIQIIDRVLMPPLSDSSQQSNAVKDLIQSAIARGVPLYNSGHAGACADLYRVTASSLLTLGQTRLTSDARSSLETALEAADTTHSADERAWILRRALDQVYEMN